jgi:hypothetical protein
MDFERGPDYDVLEAGVEELGSDEQFCGEETD